MSNVTPPNGLQTIIGQEEPYGVFQQFLDMDGSWKWVRGPSGDTDLVWESDGTITLTTPGGMPRTVAVDITSDQIANIADGSIVFVPAPGPGKILALVSAYSLPVPGTIPFDVASTDLSYEGDNNQLNRSTLYLAQGSTTPYWAQTPLTDSNWVPDAGPENAAIVSYNPSTPSPGGAIATTSLDSGGSNYAPSSVFTVDGGFVPATGVVDTVDGGGAVLTYHLTDSGNFYLPGTGVSTTSDGGISSSSLNNGGSGYVATDTFSVDGGTGATGIVDTATAVVTHGPFAISAASEVDPSFTVSGDQTTSFPPATGFTVSGASATPAAVDTVDSNNSSSTTGTFTLTSGNTAGDLGFSVNGSSSVSIPTAANLQTSTITVTAWIRAHGGVWPADGSILANFNAATTTGWFFRLVNGKINAYVFPANVAAVSSAAVSTSGYHHVAMSYDGTTVKAYIDGLPDGTAGAVLGLTPNTTQPIVIGTSNFFSLAFTGDIASPSFYNVALSDGDIATLAAGGAIGTPAISQWTFRKTNNGSYTTASSSFGGGNTTIVTNEQVPNAVGDGQINAFASTGGVVLTYHLTSLGSGYSNTVGETTTATSGLGTGLTLDTITPSGLTLNIDTIDSPNGTARVWITYNVLEMPV